MRLILAGILLATLSVAMPAAEARDKTPGRPGHGSVQGPADARQPTRLDPLGKDNGRLDEPTRGDVSGADQVQSKEGALARKIERENSHLGRELMGICRGC